MLQALGYNSEKLYPGEDRPVVNSVSDLADAFSFYFHHETAAERAVGVESSWQSILSAVEQVESKTNFIGGNAALIARTLSLSNISVFTFVKFSLFF